MNRVGDAGLAIGIFLMFATLGTTQYDDVFNGVGALTSGHRAGARPAAAARRGRQVRPVPAAGLAAGRDGGPDPGLGAHPRRDHGHRRRLPDRPVQPDLLGQPDAADRGGQRRRAHPADRAASSARPRTTSSGCWPGRRSARSATCSSASASAAAAYALAIIHLLAHGFFKANMFLGAGSVMHGMNDQVDIRRFGGLSQVHEDHLAHLHDGLAGHHRHPAVLRLLLQGADHRGRLRAGGLDRPGCSAAAALLGAGLTAFYMTRLFVLTFHGPKRWTEDIEHPHESPPIMTDPADPAGGRLGRRRFPAAPPRCRTG